MIDLHHGDCRRLLPMLPSGSVHSIVTSPPYFGLRDYQVSGQIGLEATPDAYVAALVGVFRECWRVLKDSGTVWLNLGDSYATSPPGNKPNTTALSSGLPNSIENQEMRRSAQSLINKTKIGLKPKDLIGIPWMVAFALRADGWYLRSDIIWSKPNPMPESVTDRPTKAHEYLFLLSKRAAYFYDAEAIQESSITGDPRRPYTSVGAKQLDGRPEWKSGQPRDGADFSSRNRRSVWTVAIQPFSEAHFATFPFELIEPCILAGCPPRGIVLDPFSGAGTTGLVAEANGRYAILIELSAKYVGMTQRRIAEQRGMFSSQFEGRVCPFERAIMRAA